MDDISATDLSDAEIELVTDFVEWAGEFDRQILERKTVGSDSDEIGLQEAFEYLVPIISDDASEFDAQLFRLFRMEQKVRSTPTFEYKNEDELPKDAKITPEELSRFLKKDELEEFFTLAGQMVETLSIELVMQEVVTSSRRSKSVRKRVTQKSQREREWLLFVTGVISEGVKSEIRRVYGLRSSIVHNSEDAKNFLQEVNVPSDINRAKKTINTLHDELHGIELKHRFSDLIA
ncbi:hypothetical protein [Halorussus marinus]|uniref:hypothetical protein n=1 Tax=Halorussus marinus TaxID=2505976 RepID=UPI00106EFFF9|nr:hypothetical protein [Halorussus marinus]